MTGLVVVVGVVVVVVVDVVVVVVVVVVVAVSTHITLLLDSHSTQFHTSVSAVDCFTSI